MEEEFTNKCDDELIAIVAVPPNNAAHRAAAVELHRRRKIVEAENALIQKKIKKMTLVVLIIAALTFLYTIAPSLPKFGEAPLSTSNIKPKEEYNQPTDQNERKDNALEKAKTVKPIEKAVKH